MCHKPKINTINYEPVSERYVEKEGKTVRDDYFFEVIVTLKVTT